MSPNEKNQGGRYVCWDPNFEKLPFKNLAFKPGFPNVYQMSRDSSLTWMGMDHGVSTGFKHKIFACESFQFVKQCIYLKVIESIRGEAWVLAKKHQLWQPSAWDKSLCLKWEMARWPKAHEGIQKILFLYDVSIPSWPENLGPSGTVRFSKGSLKIIFILPPNAN